MKQNSISERLINGLIKENPTFVLMLGMCPTLAVTTSAINGLGMGLTTMVVLALSNMFISLLRKVIPDKVRIPAFIVIIASFVTVVELLLKAFIPFLYDALGLYIPLIVVNCIILGRAEAYASKNDVISSLFDGIGMGLGFTCALTIIGAIRELLGAGQIFGANVMPASYVPCSIFVLAPGAFFVLAVLTAIQNKVKLAGEKKGKDMSKIQSGCNSDCMNCQESGCSKRFFDESAKGAADDLEVIEITEENDLPDANTEKKEEENDD
ncbi:MAG: electron transport complex subunit E [Lachnospiraceae bacterium]|nr:electron transport complex subunit E [Lachnospiraceae bacterium]